MNKIPATKDEIKEAIDSKLGRYFGVNYNEATFFQVYKATILTVKDILSVKRGVFMSKVKKQHAKKVYYMCMEFLVGPSLKNNLMNLALADEYREALSEMGYDIEDIYSAEPDPGLGNGGLGRLAACYMDSLTALDYPAVGFSICYEYGLFKQKIINGNQVELPDDWMNNGDSWLNIRSDKSVTVIMGGNVKEKWENGHLSIVYENYDEIQAIPYDMMISGDSKLAVNKLRLWRAQDKNKFNMNLFTQGQYVKAIEKNTNAEIITKVLYPSDNHDEGKFLRLTQQYFMVSASIQNIISDHLSEYGNLSNFKEKVSIHINDTHPALCIPELMRILIDVYSYSWETAWDTVTNVISYTNHTVMPEALECWNEALFKLKLPRIYMIICEINRRFCADLWNMYPGDWDRISSMSIVAYSQIRMANLSVIASHTVNGVSKLHSDILKKTIFHDYYKAMPLKFTNITNGITPRRWLYYSNEKLSSLLDETIGTKYRKNAEYLSDFIKYKEDKGVIEKLDKIKQLNKKTFAEYHFNKTGEKINCDSIFDVHVKRIHEYKRQLLNIMKVISIYTELETNPNANITPCTFVFGGKAAPGYYMAKEIIKLIWNVGEEISKNKRARDIIKVIFLEEYNVGSAQILIPASDISEQISLSGKEASGTGCMKFMMNGAITLGTCDGANVEIMDAVGKENMFVFGLDSDEVDELWKSGYDSMIYYRQNEKLSNTVKRIRHGFAGQDFELIANYLTNGRGISDPYMCMVDYESYMNAYNEAVKCYSDKNNWYGKSISNIACSGYFSSDRSIEEYAKNIWNLSKIQ